MHVNILDLFPFLNDQREVGKPCAKMCMLFGRQQYQQSVRRAVCNVMSAVIDVGA